MTDTTDPAGISATDVAAVDDAVARSSGTDGYGLTASGFVPKPFSRILAEKLALAKSLFGSDIDLGSGSAIRKILEVSALEDARTWAALGGMYDNQFASTARGSALSRLGEEVGFARPYLEAQGTVRLTAHLPAGVPSVSLPLGARMLTPGGHHVALQETAVLSTQSPVRDVNVVAFYPGPDSNLDPSKPDQKITYWNAADVKLGWTTDSLLTIARSQTPNLAPEAVVAIDHTQPLTGGDLMWPDARYRELLARVPRSIWTADSIQTALALVPGVRRVLVRDRIGGLDVDLPVMGTFKFVERLYGAQHDLASPYYFDVIVAATDAAIWDGADGLGVAIASAMQDLRPIGIFPRIVQADPVYVGIACNLVVKGLPLPRTSSGDALNSSPAAVALKQRLLARVEEYVDGLDIGEPVRFSEVMWALMSERGIADVTNLSLVLSPAPPDGSQPGVGDNVQVKADQVATFIDDMSLTVIV